MRDLEQGKELIKKKIPLILDGGKSSLGIESTVIDLTSYPKILRPGKIHKNSFDLKLLLKNMNWKKL